MGFVCQQPRGLAALGGTPGRGGEFDPPQVAITIGLGWRVGSACGGEFIGPGSLEPGKTLPRDANINSQVRIAFVTDAENDYFRRDEQPGEFKLFEVVGDELKPAKNW